MNWLDFLIIAAVILPFIKGLWRGALQQMFVLLTWIAAPIIALLSAPYLGDYLIFHITETSLRIQLSFFIIFLLIVILGAILRYLVRRTAGEEKINFSSRVFGGLLGFCWGVLVVNLILIIVQYYQFNLTPTLHGAWQKSKIIAYSEVMTEWGLKKINLTESEYDEKLLRFFQQVKDQQP